MNADTVIATVACVIALVVLAHHYIGEWVDRNICDAFDAAGVRHGDYEPLDETAKTFDEHWAAVEKVIAPSAGGLVDVLRLCADHVETAAAREEAGDA